MSIKRLNELIVEEQERRQEEYTVITLETQPIKKEPETYVAINSTKLDLLKVFFWRLISIPISIIVTYLFTGRADLSLSLTILLTIILTTCQFFYEKLWRYIVFEKS